MAWQPRRGSVENPVTIAIEPWPWPFGEQDGFEAEGDFYRLYDWDRREPWQIVSDREERAIRLAKISPKGKTK